jgi:hypothetical protein
MVAAFTLPEEVLPGPARRQIIGFSLVVPALVAALLWRSWIVMPLACFTVASLLWYVSIILRLLRRRRMPIDWSMRHVQAAMLHLGAAMLCGLTFVFGVDAGSALGTHLAVAYGVFALLGWVSNFILGMGSRLAPGLTAAPGQSPRPLFAPHIQAAIFWCFNLGVLGIALASLTDATRLLRTALTLTLVSTLLFARALIRRVRTMLRSRPAEAAA